VRLPYGRTFKGTSSTVMMDGVSTYLALTFGTLLSSQGTDASFGPVSPGPPGASLRYFVFRLYQIAFRSVSGSKTFSDSPVGGVSTTLAAFSGGS
ncbi:hypothetical protein, partial [Streptomyces luteosporeus]|uniref:hypothetical protein n=1 Tax=Streptomyces luteosporeus TaxID=173856 RepID=UPI0031D20378